MFFKPIPDHYKLTSSFTDNTALAADGFTPSQEQEWWTPTVDRKTLKSLMKRQDAAPVTNHVLWLATLVVSGVIAYRCWGTWWVLPALFVYGTIYSSCDPRSHDLGHGATFKTRWLNSAFLYLSLFMTLKEPVLWRWRHTRHHTDTIHAGRDPEILVKRPADLLRVFADFFFLVSAYEELKPSVIQSFGVVSGEAKHFVPESEHGKMIWSSRFLVGSVVLVVALSIAFHTWMPLAFLWGPRFYANWLNFFGFLTQHAGLAEDSYDHRLNTRTFYLNPVLAFLYANMNYHIEHHINPMIPYYNLPQLHRIMTDNRELPYTYKGLIDCHREVIPALFRQAREENYFVRREMLPI